MEWISGFLDSTDRSDMSLVIWKRSWLSGNMAKHEIKFGKGWMGRGGEIQYVRHRYTGDLKGVGRRVFGMGLFGLSPRQTGSVWEYP
jgi:hypothetical protein